MDKIAASLQSIFCIHLSFIFLYSAAEKYVGDAEKDNKPELVKLWNRNERR
jgi:hypothetical protein